LSTRTPFTPNLHPHPQVVHQPSRPGPFYQAKQHPESNHVYDWSELLKLHVGSRGVDYKAGLTPFSGLLFRHEGWPLCIHDKIVVQLCPLNQHLLHPGDFYLLVSPAAATLGCGAHSASCRSSVSVKPCLLLCSVSAGSRHVEQQEVPLEALTSLFSMAWLDSVNRERERRGATRLERCVLSAHGDVFRVPWEDVVYPQFINRPRTTTNQERESSLKDKNDPRLSRKDVKLLPFPSKPNQSTVSSDDEDSEGEYVELTELPVLTRFSPQKGSLTQSISLQHRTRTTIHTKLHTDTLTPHTEIQSTSHTNTHQHQLSTETSQNTSTPSTTVTPSSIAHFNSNTHSCFCTEVSSHTLQCCKLLEENFSQDSSGVLHISSGPPITCSAPPEVKEQTEGTTSGGSPNMHAQPERCTQHGEGKENEQKVGEVEQGKEEEKEANNRRSEGLESVCGEREERLQQVKETESRSKEEEESEEEHPPPVSIEGQGNGDDQMYKEKEEEQLCDKNVGRRSTDHQPEGFDMNAWFSGKLLIPNHYSDPGGCSLSDITSCVKQDGGSGNGADCFGGCSAGCSWICHFPCLPDSAELLLSKYRAVMCSTLEDIRLVQLQQEGGASLAWLRREEVSGVSEEQQAAVENVSTLYDQVDELLHRLVTLSNSKTQELSFIVEFRSLEQGFSQVKLSMLSVDLIVHTLQGLKTS
ncbi:hypothetical protein XENOCAPTIV_006512, partial [Xenoophorus captivus]